MYEVTKRIEIAGAHCLDLPYASNCNKLHGHNWIIEIACKASLLNESGMVIDFTDIKREVMTLDHENLGDFLDVNPTAENIAEYLHKRVSLAVSSDAPMNRGFKVTKVTVQESEGNTACYIP